MTADAGAPAERFAARHWAFLFAAAAAEAAYILLHWSQAYIDFGDGNYLYIASRIAEGAVVYRDILAPQPPCHLFLGAGLLKIADALGIEPQLYFVRGFSLLLRLATYFLVADLARAAWGRARAGILAGAVFLLLPIGFWWSLGYQSEPLEVFFLVAMMRAAACCPGAPSLARDAAAGILGALAALTNATAAPFLLVLIVYMFIVNPRRALRLAVPALALAAAVTAALEAWTGGYFLNNVVFNQVGTYPRGQFLSYAAGKILREGSDMLRLEGAFVLLAALGVFRLLKSSPMDRETLGGLVWFCLATMASFLYVTKGGTVDYIFSLAGPAIALLAAGELEALAARLDMIHARIAEGRLPRLIAFAGLPAALFLAAALLAPGFIFLWGLLTQSAYELPDLAHAGKDASGQPRPNVEQVRAWIERHSKPGDTILAPPFYAYTTGRKLWQDYSELFIWRIKDLNDRMDEKPDGEGWSKTRALAAAIENKELPIVIIEMGQQGQLPEIAAALEKSYAPLIPEPYPTLNTQLGVYIPKAP